MNWMFRVMGFLILALLNLLLFLLSVVLRTLLVPIFVAILWLIRSLMLFSITATINGPRQYIDRRAGEWTERIYEGSSSREHMSGVFQLCRLLVGIIIVLGWLVSGFFTYSIVRVYFVFFT